MSDEDGTDHPYWTNTPSTLVDQVIGYTLGNGIARVTLGQIAYDPRTSQSPILPVVSIGVTERALALIIEQLSRIKVDIKAFDQPQ